jgi:predicted transglutaminase-like cysteine proteinase
MSPFPKVPKTIAAACIAAFATLAIAGTAPDAWGKSRKAAAQRADDFLAPMTTPAPGPAKFFTINAVLAKLDSRAQGQSDQVRLASLTPSETLTDAPAQSIPAPAIGMEPFGLFAFRAPEGALWRKWRGVEADITKEKEILARCETDMENCPSHAAQFTRLIKAIKSRSGREQLDEANRGVNTAIHYVSDTALHGEVDRWSAPLATFAAARGDCEDYAIAKYVALREAGFPVDDMRLVLVRDRSVREDHAVLAARHDGHWMIMDNRRSNLVEDNDVTSFTPLFAINHRGVHLFATPYAKRIMQDNETTAPAAESEDRGRNIDAEALNQSEPVASGGGFGTTPLLI